MAQIQISLSGSSVINGSRVYVLSDADVTRLIAWAKTISPPPSGTLTDAQALLVWIRRWISDTTQAIRNLEGNAAGAAANAAVSPPAMTEQ